MGIWDIFKRKNNDFKTLDYAELDKMFETAYLKGLAIDKCAEFLARIFATSKFIYQRDNQIINNQWSYIFNVQPNKNENASQFWKHLIYKLLTENEVLVVKSQDDQLLIADAYLKKDTAFYGSTFESVSVGSFTFKSIFKSEDVIFLQYNNNRLDRYIDRLFDDYRKLYERVTNVISHNGQIRGALKIEGASKFDNKQMEDLKNYQERLFSAFKDRSVAIVPIHRNIDYVDLTGNGKQSNTSVDELKKLRRQFEDDVAEILGIPTAILHGEMADLESSKDALRRFCLESINKLVEDELMCKTLTQADIQKGVSVKVIGLARNDVFALATSVDKLISSGAFTRNEIRNELNYPSVDGGDEFIITKNYEPSELKGGEKDEEN